jgi:hypothetical protein
MDLILMIQKHLTAPQIAQTLENHSLGQNQKRVKQAKASDLPLCWNWHTCEGMDEVAFSLA